MKEFKVSYDEENDDLFVYLEGCKSAGAVEMGNFVFDFDEDENLVAFQISDASETLSNLIKRVIKASKIKALKAGFVSFRNMAAVSIEINFDGKTERATLLIPRIKENSPIL